MILLTGDGDVIQLATISGVMLSVIAAVFVLFLLAGRIERLLGKIGINVVSRLLGMMLAALSVQFVLDGLRDFGLAGG
mgnify:FL=1